MLIATLTLYILFGWMDLKIEQSKPNYEHWDCPVPRVLSLDVFHFFSRVCAAGPIAGADGDACPETLEGTVLNLSKDKSAASATGQGCVHAKHDDRSL